MSANPQVNNAVGELTEEEVQRAMVALEQAQASQEREQALARRSLVLFLEQSCESVFDLENPDLNHNPTLTKKERRKDNLIAMLEKRINNSLEQLNDAGISLEELDQEPVEGESNRITALREGFRNTQRKLEKEKILRKGLAKRREERTAAIAAKIYRLISPAYKGQCKYAHMMVLANMAYTHDIEGPRDAAKIYNASMERSLAKRKGGGSDLSYMLKERDDRERLEKISQVSKEIRDESQKGNGKLCNIKESQALAEQIITGQWPDVKSAVEYFNDPTYPWLS